MNRADVLARLREISALVAADETHTLYQDLGDGNGPVDGEAWEAIANAQKLRGLTAGSPTQDERLAVLDMAISEVAKLRARL